jgi:methionyl-tRNA formyltransferase
MSLQEVKESVLRVVYFGSPEFAVPTLKSIAESPSFDVVLVVTQGAKGASPVEQAAQNLELPVYKPTTLRDSVSRRQLVEADAHLFVVAAFGLIFRQRTLDIPRLGAINVHPSLLPKYRGASPIAAAIDAGDLETGVSLMVMDPGIDTGAVVSVERAAVMSEDTTESLGSRLASIGAAQAVRDIPRWVAGELIPVPQPNQNASLTRTLTKADGWIDWTRSAVEIERHVRAMWPWPRAWTAVHGTLVQVHSARVADLEIPGQAPGSVVPARKRLIVACSKGALELLIVEPAGRRAMRAAAYLNGLRAPLEQLGDTGAPQVQPPLIVPVDS